MSPLPHRKFGFDTVFDGAGGFTEPPRPKRAYTAEEMEAARAAAYAEGQASSVSQAEARQAAALGQAAQAIAQGLGALTQVAHAHRTDAARLAMAAGRAVAGAALDRFPEAPATEAMAALSRELESSPRVALHLPAGSPDRVREALEQAAARAGFPGALAFHADPAAPAAAFVIDWGDGRAAFDPVAAAARVADALETALAVEGLHAEPPICAKEAAP